jgi:uncharacterized protein YjcR
MGRPPKADSERKRNQAYELYMSTYMTHAEIAEAVGVGIDTVSNWCSKGQWKQAKAANSITREKNVSMMLVQLNNLLENINTRPQANRYATPAEADSITKMSQVIDKLSGRTSLPDYFNVQTEFIKFLHSANAALAQQVVDYSKEFLQLKTRELER